MSSTVAKRIMLFCGSAHSELGGEIAKALDIEIGKVELSTFANGEIYVRLLESVRGADVFVVQTIAPPVNKNFMELLIMIDALKRASARRIVAVIPHYAYARQDKKTLPREPITAKLVADLLEKAGASRILTMDLHAGQIQGFFNIPADHLTAMPVLLEYIAGLGIKDLVIASPDVGRVKTAKKFADELGAELAILHKSRPVHNKAVIMDVVGEVEGKNTVLVDDMIDTGGTIVEGVRALKGHGARDIYVCATHPILSGPAVGRLKAAEIKEIVLTNTLPLTPEKVLDNMKILSIAPLFAQAIESVYNDESVSEIFKGNNQW